MRKNFTLVISQALFVILFSACKVEKPVVDNQSAAQKTEVSKDTTRAVTPEPPEPRVYHGSRTRHFDLIHTKLDFSLDWEKQRLNGTAVLQLKPYFYPQDKLLLDAKNFDIHYIQLIEGVKRTDLEYFYDNRHLMIMLDTVYTREEEIFIEIKYTAKPAERITGGSKAITSDQGLYFINHDGSDPDKPMQVWTQGETESNSCWFPTIDSPNERMTQELYITVKQKYVTLSNGELIYSKFNEDSTRTDYWKMSKSHAPYLVMFVVGDFEIVEDTYEGLPLYYYMEPEYAPYAKDVFGATPEMIDYFSDILDYEFPWSKYAQIVVRDYVSGAMENTSASLYYDALNVDSRELIDYDFEGIIAHELFHQWFGDLVTLESWANLTLNEGFANYSEYLWNEYKYGKYEAGLHNLDETEQYLQEAEEEKKDLIRFYYDDKENMFDSHSYAKGGRIIHMLRKYVGDDAFFTALNRYLVKHKFSSVEVHDLRLVFEEVTGEDLNWFFNQWFLASGHPVIEVRDTWDGHNLKIEISQLQDVDETPVYRLPLYIDVWVNNEKTRFYVIIDQQRQAFEFEFDVEPDLVLFDGEQQLLAEITHDKTMEEYIYQFRNTDHFLSRYIALDTLLSDPDDSLASPILAEALQDPFWFYRQMAVDALEEYERPISEDIEELLVKIAKHDNESNVRADALQMLFELYGDKYSKLYLEALNDSSYMVTGTAIFAVSATMPEEMGKLASRFEKYDNINIVIPLASYYIDEGGHEKYNWFVNKIRSADSEALWYLLQYFAEYIMDAGELVQRRAIALLEGYARDHSQNYVRLSAYQSLGLLSDLSGVDELMADIKEKEKDDDLKRIYNTFP